MRFASKQQLDSQRKTYPLLPQDDYVLAITKVEESVQDNYEGTEVEDIVNFTFEIQGCKDGSSARDMEGGDAVGRKVFFTGRQNKETKEWSTGFMQDGTPSKLRCLVAYSTGQDVFEEIEIHAWEQLLGKVVFAEIIQYVNKKGQKRNKISRFIPQKKKLEDKDIPVIEEHRNEEVEGFIDNG